MLVSDNTLRESLHLDGIRLRIAKRLLALQRIEDIASGCGPARGAAYAAEALRVLDVSVSVHGLNLIDLVGSGAKVIVANHPHGLLDGLILLALGGERLQILANYMLSEIQPLNGALVYVNPLQDGGDGRANVAVVRRMLREADGRSLGIFPAGDVTGPRSPFTRFRERPWHRSAARLVRLLDRPVVPIHISGSASMRYWLANAIDRRVGLMMLPRELLRAKGSRVDVVVGEPFRLPRDALRTDTLADARYLADRVHDLALTGSVVGPHNWPVARPCPSPIAMVGDGADLSRSGFAGGRRS